MDTIIMNYKNFKTSDIPINYLYKLQIIYYRLYI